MTRRRRVGAAVVAGAVVLATAALGLTRCDRASEAERTARTRARQTREAALRAGLPRDVADVLGRYAGASGEVFSITYSVANPPGTTLVLVQDPPRKRVDVTGVEDGKLVTRSLFQLANGQFNCALLDDKWACDRADQEVPALGVLGPEDVKRTIDTLEASKASYTFEVERRRMLGVVAECLVSKPRPGATPGSAPASLCLSPEGAPLLLEGGPSPLRAARYSTKVDTRRFVLPASP